MSEESSSMYFYLVETQSVDIRYRKGLSAKIQNSQSRTGYTCARRAGESARGWGPLDSRILESINWTVQLITRSIPADTKFYNNSNVAAK